MNAIRAALADEPALAAIVERELARLIAEAAAHDHGPCCQGVLDLVELEDGREVGFTLMHTGRCIVAIGYPGKPPERRIEVDRC